jgi:hypothetical protein
VRSDDDSIQISLIRFFTQRPCLDLRCQALTYLRSGLAWTSAARPLLTYLLTSSRRSTLAGLDELRTGAFEFVFKSGWIRLRSSSFC